MTEVLFYHLTQSPLEANLPAILEKSLERGWRVLVQGMDSARLRFLDEYLWTRAEEGFLPHGIDGEGNEVAQPVLLSEGNEAVNQAHVLILVDGARFQPANSDGFERVCLIFDGNDAGILSAAREDWKKVKETGWQASYWAQENGRWVKKG